MENCAHILDFVVFLGSREWELEISDVDLFSSQDRPPVPQPY